MTREELAAIILAELQVQGGDGGMVGRDCSRLDQISLDGIFDLVAIADAISRRLDRCH